jgi:O-antigen/teichoic acid export membrane protein
MISNWVRSFIGSENSLRRKLLGNSNYALLSAVAVAGADTLKTAIYARALEVSDYGLMALAVTVIGLLESFTMLGINVLIQRDGDGFIDKLPVYWTIKVVRGASLFLIAWIVAPFAAEYYNEADLVWMIRFLGVGFLLRGVSGFGVEVRQRQLAFKKVAWAEGGSSLCVLGLGLLLLFWVQDVWALAAYNMIRSATQLVVSYALFPWKPRMHFEPSVARGMFSFGGAITVVMTVSNMMASVENGVIGRVVKDLEVVGFYSMARFLAYTPAFYLGNVLGPVFLPSLRQIIDDVPRFRRAYYKALRYYTLFFALIAAAFWFGGHYLILGFYGEQWLPALSLFKILIFFGFFKAVFTLCPSVFYLNERPWLMAVSAVVPAVVFAAVCVPMTERWGAEGMAWTLVGTAGLGLVLGLGFIEYLLRPSNGENDASSKKLI